MSGRIRTIKPELLEDEKTASLNDLEFRLFVSAILMADDYGNLRGEPGFVRGQALWASAHSAEAVGAGLNALVELGLLQPYDVRGQRYLQIAGWSKHQKVDKPGKPRVPGPADPEVAAPRDWQTYFVRLGDDGPIKIGKTLDLPARVAKLQTSAPGPLQVLAVVGANVEAECHRRFSSLRTHGEWFRPEPELVDFVEKLASRAVRESFANHSRTGSEPFATDLRPPTNDPDHRPRAYSSNSPAAPSDACSGSDVETASNPDAPAAATDGPSEAEQTEVATSEPAADEAAVKAKLGATAEVHRVFEVWRALHATPRSKLDGKRAARIRSRLAEGWSVDELEAALRGALLDNWLMGRDPKSGGRAYRGLETLLRDSAQVERLKALHEAPRRPAVVVSTGRATQTVDPVTGYVSVTDHRGLPAQGYDPKAPWLKGILTPLPADEPGNDGDETPEARRVAG